MTTQTKILIGALAAVFLGAAAVVAFSPPMSVDPLAASNPSFPNFRVEKPVVSEASSDLPVLAERMPEFQGISKWWQTPDGQPLTPESLKGKVVLVDFWTYSCINCIRTYPFLRTMWERYVDKGLVIVGVHTPEFAFEKDPANVERELKKNKLAWPIALDPDYGTWSAYNNRYWPAGYFFDRQGRLRHVHFGEGSYDESEMVIRELLEEDGAKLPSMGAAVQAPDFSKIRTPETYFGLERGAEFMGVPGKDGVTMNFTAANDVAEDRWTAGGKWTFHPEYAQGDSNGALFRFNVQANQLHLVLSSSDGKDKNIEIFVDGKRLKGMKVNASQLYDIASFPDAGRHTVEVWVMDAGVRFYAATFS